MGVSGAAPVPLLAFRKPRSQIAEYLGKLHHDGFHLKTLPPHPAAIRLTLATRIIGILSTHCKCLQEIN